MIEHNVADESDQMRLTGTRSRVSSVAEFRLKCHLFSSRWRSLSFHPSSAILR